MLKNATYKEKFELLKEWFPTIVQEIKSDLKNDHLKQDSQFSKKYFPGKNVPKLTAEELSAGYLQAFSQEPEADNIADFIFNQWLLKNTDVYQYFETSLEKIDPNFTELTELSAAHSTTLINGSVQQFGPTKTYLFSVINSVVFPKSAYDSLRIAAQKADKETATTQAHANEQKSLESMKHSHAQEIARLTDKYEKKLQGLQKKYMQDTEALKKQVATLQRKISGNG
ncbi:MAG: hypothetical protein H0X51_01065 [Parachlamydiaceae bacterium]|nr:hypothetical protein [Parachlamydiaceae bacterium]